MLKMDFISSAIEVFASCFIQDEEWNMRRIVVTIAVVIAIVVLGFLFWR
jgi:hypothetical protein